jgi:putative hydroxymethylpyrimidine transport system substrate-binding protein
VPVVAVAAIVPRALNSIIARGGQGIHTPADLRGRTIGVDGSASTSAYVDTVLRHAGLDPAHDVHLVDVGFNLVPALVSGRVDAIAGAFQNVEGVQLRQRGLHPVVFPVDRYGVPSYDELVLVASRDRLAERGYREAVRRFLAALVQGTAWARAHPAIMARHVAAGYRSVLDASVPATLRLLRPPAGEPYGHLDAGRWAAFGAWMHRQGLLKAPPHARALVDDALLPHG